MHGISDLRLPALTVGVVYRTGYGYAPAQPADRKKQDGQARRTMHFISVKLVTSNRKAAHVTTPAELKEDQTGHDPEEGIAPRRVRSEEKMYDTTLLMSIYYAVFRYHKNTRYKYS